MKNKLFTDFNSYVKVILENATETETETEQEVSITKPSPTGVPIRKPSVDPNPKGMVDEESDDFFDSMTEEEGKEWLRNKYLKKK